MDELLKAIKQKLANMKKIESTGFTDPAKAAEYFRIRRYFLKKWRKLLKP